MRGKFTKFVIAAAIAGTALTWLLRESEDRPVVEAQARGGTEAALGAFYANHTETDGGTAQASLLARIASALRGAPAQQEFYRPYEAVLTHYQIEKVTDRAAAESRPYHTEEGRQKALERAKKNLEYFKAALVERERRFANAEREGRNEAEISEGRAALEELKRGITASKEKVRRIQEDDFDQ